MLLWLFNFLQGVWEWQVPAAFFYVSTRMLLAAFTSLFFALCLGPQFIRKLYELKAGQPMRLEDCPALAELHKKKKDTPTMGGLLILSAILLSLLLWMDLHFIGTWILAAATLCFGAIGALDDYLKLKYKNSKGLSGKKKLLYQGSFSLLLAFYLFCPAVQESVESITGLKAPFAKEQVALQEGEKPSMKTLSLAAYSSQYYLPFMKDPVLMLTGAGTILAIVWVLFVIIGSSNAVNLTDGLDGLAAGCLIMVSSLLALVAFLSNHVELSKYLNILYIEGSGEIAVYLMALSGACLGFLWFNGSPAQVFMGDTGSLALGGVLGVCAILLRREFLLAIAGGVFVMEALSVILQVASFKLRNKKRIFLCTPFHHHFEYKGWPETKVVLRFWIIGWLLCLIALVSLKLQ